jgi:carbamoyl-phosphate synthase large subunit
MKSTGEVMGIAADFGSAFAKSQIAAFGALPVEGAVFLSLADKDKEFAAEPARKLAQLGFAFFATTGTHHFLANIGIESVLVLKNYQPHDGQLALTALDLIREGKVNLVINTPYGKDERQDGRLIRTATIVKNLPCVTTIAGFRASVEAIASLQNSNLAAKPIQEWLAGKKNL